MSLTSTDFNIILASQSPRRKDLLSQLGYRFTQVALDIDESFPDSIEIKSVAEYLSKKKSAAYQELKAADLLITSDTIVCLDGTILGKPSNHGEALEMLQQLSAKKHTVITGVCIRTVEKTLSFSVATDVYMKELQKEEILHYVDTFQPFDKAGAYGIQEWIGFIGVERIDGSFYNVMGLPVKELYEAIETF